MLSTGRSCSYRIITRALAAAGRPLVGLLLPGADDCESGVDADQLQATLLAHPEAVVVYNQHADAAALVDALSVPDSQVFIEIRQDTRGVPGLHAQRRHGANRETLELIYQEN